MQNSQKSPKKRKSKATIHQKKNSEMREKIYPKKISQKAKKAKTKDKITQKSLQQLGTGAHPKGRGKGFLRSKTVKKAKLGSR